MPTERFLWFQAVRVDDTGIIQVNDYGTSRGTELIWVFCVGLSDLDLVWDLESEGFGRELWWARMRLVR